jgi:tetratricopeptide (TPR) repeat protein
MERSSKVTDRKINHLRDLLDKLVRNEHWEKALYIAEYLATLRPEDPGLERVMGIAHLHLADLEKSEDCFKRSLEYGADDPDTFLYLARVYQNRSDFRNEIFWLEKVLECEPENPIAQFRLAVVCISLGDTDRAEQILEATVKKYPDYVHAHRVLADIHLSTGNLEAAEEQLREAIAVSGDNPVLLCELGHILNRKEEFAEALACFFQALEHNRGDATLYYNIGDTFIALGEPENSITYLRKAEELSAFDPVIQMELGRAYYDMGRYQQCIAASRSGLQYDPAMVLGRTNIGINTMQNLGLSYMHLENYPEAEACFRKNISLAAPGFFNLGLSLHRQNRYDEALRYFQWAAGLDPNDAECQDMIGNAYLELGRLKEAKAALEKAIALDSSYAPAWYDLGIVLSRMKGKEVKALELFEHARDLDDKNYWARYSIGCLHALQGRRDLALENLDAAVRRGFSDRDYLENDRDWDSLRADPGFREIAEGMNGKNA